MSPVRITRRDALRLTLAAATATAARHPVLAAPPAWQEAPSLAEASKGASCRTWPSPANEPRDRAARRQRRPLWRGHAHRRARRCRPQRHPAHHRQHGPDPLVAGLRGRIPNVAESWTTNADASVYTFKLRAGMRWSDGHPFTADDIIFFTDDLLANREFYAAPPPQYVINGELMRGEKVDDATVRLIFAGPYLTFPERLAGPLGQHPILYAKHYCSQFMPKYNPDVGKLLAATNQPELVGVVPPALRRYRNAGAVGQPGAPGARSVGDQGALHRRRHRGRRRAQPVFLAGRSGGQAASLPRRGELQGHLRHPVDRAGRGRRADGSRGAACRPDQQQARAGAAREVGPVRAEPSWIPTDTSAAACSSIRPTRTRRCARC